MPPAERPFRSLGELHHHDLECLHRTWHRELGVAAALHYCAEHRLTPPLWLVENAAEILYPLLKPEKTSLRGRARGVVARYRQDMIDFARADAVAEMRAQQSEIRRQVEEMRSNRGVPPAMIKERTRMLAWVGRGWLRAYECAAMLLAESAAAGGPDAMKASYLRVRRNSRGGDLRHYGMDPHFLRSVGIPNVSVSDDDTPLHKRTL